MALDICQSDLIHYLFAIENFQALLPGWPVPIVVHAISPVSLPILQPMS